MSFGRAWSWLMLVLWALATLLAGLVCWLVLLIFGSGSATHQADD